MRWRLPLGNRWREGSHWGQVGPPPTLPKCYPQPTWAQMAEEPKKAEEDLLPWNAEDLAYLKSSSFLFRSSSSCILVAFCLSASIIRARRISSSFISFSICFFSRI